MRTSYIMKSIIGDGGGYGGQITIPIDVGRGARGVAMQNGVTMRNANALAG